MAEPTAFSIEQEEAILAAAKKIGKDWLPVCLIARHTGLRYGDIARLKWREVDLAEAGADIETRKKILGHTTDMNAERYDHSPHLNETRAAIEAASKATKKGESTSPRPICEPT